MLPSPVSVTPYLARPLVCAPLQVPTRREQPLASGVDLTFQSDWATASLGSALVDIRDNSKWSTSAGNGIADGGCFVASATGLGFPSGMAQVLRVDAYKDAGPTWVQQANVLVNSDAAYGGAGIGQLTAGTSHFYRCYWRVAFPFSVMGDPGNGNHPIEENGGGAENWELLYHVPSDVSWRPGIGPRVSNRFMLSINGNDSNATYLAQSETYRFEWELYAQSDSTLEMHIWVYDSGNNLLFSDPDFVNGAIRLSSNQSFAFSAITKTEAFMIGTNGPNLSTEPMVGQPTGTLLGTMHYIGGVAVSDTTKCGQWAQGESI